MDNIAGHTSMMDEFYCTGKLHLFVGDNCSCLRSALTSGSRGLLDDEVKKLCTTNLSLFGASQSRSVVQMDSESKGEN